MDIKESKAFIFIRKKLTYEVWLNIILAIAVAEYLHLVYIDIKSINIISRTQDYQFKLISTLSFVDLVYLPIIFYIFYKRKRWGWITFFGVKLFTLFPSLLFYYREYYLVDGVITFPNSLLLTLLDIPILIFLCKKDVGNIFNVTRKAKLLTVIAITLTIWSVYLLYNTGYSTTESHINENSGQIKKDSAIKRQALFDKLGIKSGASTYMPTGFYFLVDSGKGVRMVKERSNELYTVSSMPFASVKNIIKTTLEKSHFKDVDYTNFCVTFNDKGTKDLAEGTGNPLHPTIAVIIANRLIYVVKNAASIKGGIMCIALIGYSDQELEKMKAAVDNQR